MVKQGVSYSILMIMSLLAILLFLGFQFHQPDPVMRIKKPQQQKKEEPATREVQIVAVREQLKKIEKEQIKPHNTSVRVFKPAVNKIPNAGVSDHKMLRVNGMAIQEGRKVLAEKGMIPLVQTSDDQIGFYAYLKKMKNMGGRLFIGDADEQTILAEAEIFDEAGEFKIYEIKTSAIGQVDISELAFFRPRELVHENLADEIVRKGKALFGNRDLRCVLMLPMDVEAGILGSLKQYLSDKGFSIDMFDIVWGSYLRSDSGIYLNITSGRLRSSQELVSLNLDLTL